MNWAGQLLFAALLLHLSLGPGARAAPLELTVMTQNLYLGADTKPILQATTPAALQTAIQAAAQSVVLNNFPLRATAIAGEAASARGPLLIGLQEAEIVSGAGATLNYADALIAALKARGLNYTYNIQGVGAAVHTGFTLDSALAGLPGLFSLTDQEVVLVRTDVPGFTVTSVSAPTFVHNVTVTSPLLGPISLQRGYVLVDATLDGVAFKFVSTHLDETQSSAQPAEVSEILTALGAGGEPQLVVGDFNASPSDVCGGLSCGPAGMLSAGFIDTGNALGPTCCQAVNLDNTVSSLSKRYDYIFERGVPSINSAFLVGDKIFEDARPVWPSDHAGVIAAVPEPAAGAFFVLATWLFCLAWQCTGRKKAAEAAKHSGRRL